MAGLGALERRLRSSVFGSAFSLINRCTRYEIAGAENLKRAAARSRERGTPLITISNHLSLFDDPMVLARVLDLPGLNTDTKTWFSTPCATNFSPAGKSLWSRMVRYFSDVSKMVFMARPQKGAALTVPDSYVDALAARGDDLRPLMEELAAREGVSAEACLRRFLTPGGPEVAALNQLGMLEACVRVATGGWLHMFPEGGRSRTLELRKPRKGVGKVIYHCPEAEIVPFCFYGTQDVLPVGGLMPKLFKRVVVAVGPAIPAASFASLRAAEAGPETYQALATDAWQSVVSLREAALTRYLGQDARLPTALPRLLPQLSSVASS